MKLAFLIMLSVAPAWSAAVSDPLDFSMKPAELETRCGTAIRRAGKRLNRLERVHSQRRTFGNYAAEFENTVADLKRDTAAATFLKYVSTDKDIRRASRNCETRVELYLIEVYSRTKIYKALKEMAEAKPTLEPIDDRLLRQTLTDFRRAGQDLDRVDRARFRLLREMHVELKEKFGLNLSRAKDFNPLLRHEPQRHQADQGIEYRNGDPHIAQGKREDPFLLFLDEIRGTLESGDAEHRRGETQIESPPTADASGDRITPVGDQGRRVLRDIDNAGDDKHGQRDDVSDEDH